MAKFCIVFEPGNRACTEFAIGWLKDIGLAGARLLHPVVRNVLDAAYGMVMQAKLVAIQIEFDDGRYIGIGYSSTWPGFPGDYRYWVHTPDSEDFVVHCGLKGWSESMPLRLLQAEINRFTDVNHGAIVAAQRQGIWKAWVEPKRRLHPIHSKTHPFFTRDDAPNPIPSPEREAGQAGPQGRL